MIARRRAGGPASERRRASDEGGIVRPTFCGDGRATAAERASERAGDGGGVKDGATLNCSRR